MQQLAALVAAVNATTQPGWFVCEKLEASEVDQKTCIEETMVTDGETLAACSGSGRGAEERPLLDRPPLEQHTRCFFTQASSSQQQSPIKVCFHFLVRASRLKSHMITNPQTVSVCVCVCVRCR